MTDPTTTGPADQADERADLLSALARHRGFLKQTLQGLTHEQAGSRPTVSELCLGGLVKHVGNTERQWIDFAISGEQDTGPDIDWANIDWSDPAVAAMMQERAQEFQLLPGETVADVLAGYDEVAADTERRVAELDLGHRHALPAAPWFEPGTEWSVRRVLMHMIAETAQHSGHADIIREAIDGAKTMG